MAGQLLSLMICLLLAQVYGEEIKFSYSLDKQTNQCFMQNMQVDHQGFVSISSQSVKCILTVNDPKGRQIENQMGERKMEKSFKVEVGGAHQICIQNTDVGAVTFELTVKSGDWSDDHAKAITKKHLRPVELQAYKVNEMVGQLREQMGQFVVSGVRLSDQNEDIRSRVLIFGCISIFVMAVSTVLQVKYLKNFFRYKKII